MILSISVFALSACSGISTVEPGASSSLITLQPYQASVTSADVTPQVETTNSSTPTSEPVIYTVVSGDSLSVIALRFGVDLNALIQANPTVNPNAMPIGTKLVIPPKGNEAGNNTGAVTGLPTPVVQADKGPDCYRTDDNQWICFLLIRNDRQEAIGNISGQVMQPGSSSSFTATCPLDMIPAGESLPLIARIQNQEIDPARMDGKLTTALPIGTTDTRFGTVVIAKQTINYSTDRRSAEVSGELVLAAGGIARVLVFAQDSSDRVVGYRVWETAVSLQAGMTQSFHIYLYSLGDPIAVIHLVAQARLR